VEMKEERGKSSLLKVWLRIEVRDKWGKLVDIREKEGDLILDNFRDILAALLLPEFEWPTVTGVKLTPFEKYAALVDYGGTAYNVPLYGGRTVGTNINETIALTGVAGYDKVSAGLMGVRIRIGTSTVTPTRGDYKLGAEVASAIPSQTIGADYISWAVSITLTEAADIAEAGMTLRCIRSLVGAAMAISEFLLFRDTFTVVSVPAGGTISVTYTLSL